MCASASGGTTPSSRPRSSRRSSTTTDPLSRRPAVDADRPFVERAQRAAYEDLVRRVFGSWDTAAIDRSFAAKWAEGGFEIVEADGAPVGAIWVQRADDHVRLREVFLLPAAQGRGLGTRLVRDAIERAHAAGLPLRLRVLAESRAVSLYRRLGLRTVSAEGPKIWMQTDPA